MSDHTYPVFRAAPDGSERPWYPQRRTSPNPPEVDRAARSRETDERPRCVWPGCLALQAGQQGAEEWAAYGGNPMCITHIYDTWQLAEDATSSEGTSRRIRWLENTMKREMPSTVPGGNWPSYQPMDRHPGDIYYLEIDSHIKIGYSSNLPRRIREYPPSAVLLAYHPGSRVDETSFHRLFTEHRAARREWYVDHPNIREHIQRVINRYGPPPKLELWQQPELRPQHVSKRARSGGTFGR